MKTRKIMLALFLCIVMVAAVCLAAACQKDKEFKIDLRSAKDWGNDYDETAYTVSNDKDGNLIFDYEKNDTYQLMKRTMVEQVEDLQKVKKIVLVAEMTSSEATPHLLLKLEGTDEVADNPVKAAAEVNITMKSGENTYEWDFRQFSDGKAYDLTKASSLLIFADPGVATAKGKITIKEFYFSDKELDTANAVTLPAKPTPAEKPTYTWQEMKAGDFDLTDWQDGGMGVYSVTKDNGTVKVHVDKDAVEGDDKYIALLSIVYGDALKTVKSFRIDIKGTAGTTALIKPFDYKDFNVTFDGTVQHFEFDIASQAARADADFSKKDEPTADNKVAILALQGAESGKTDIEIISAEFSTEPAKVEEDTPTKKTTEITLDNTKVGTDWYTLDAGEYTPTVDANGTTVHVSYKKTGGYSNVQAFVKGSAIAQMKSITFTVKGTAGKQLMFKPFDRFEQTLDLDGTEQTLTIDISTYVEGKTFADPEPINIIAEPGDSNIGNEGSFDIIRVEFSKTAAPIVETKYTGGQNVDINRNWRYDNDDEHFTVSARDNHPLLTFTAQANHYASAYTKVELGTQKMNYAIFEIKGTEGKHAIVKFGGIEYKLDDLDLNGTYGPMTGDWQTVIIKLATPVTGDQKIEIMAGFKNAQDAGEMEIKRAQLYNVFTVDDTHLDLIGAWNDTVDGRFTVTTAQDKVTVSCSTPGSYEACIIWLDLGEGGYDKISFKVKGLAGHRGGFKVEPNTEYMFRENRALFTGEEETFELSLADRTGLVQLSIFLEFDNDGTPGNAEGGSVEILQATVTKAAA